MPVLSLYDPVRTVSIALFAAVTSTDTVMSQAPPEFPGQAVWPDEVLDKDDVLASMARGPEGFSQATRAPSMEAVSAARMSRTVLRVVRFPASGLNMSIRLVPPC